LNNSNISWKDVAGLWSPLKVIFKWLFVVAIMDLALSIGLSFFISDAFYYNRYMASDLWEEKSRYKEIIGEYFAGQYNLQPDAAAGWVNTPNYQKAQLQWSTDYLGSRVPPAQAKVDVPPQIDPNDDSVFLIGSSVLSGYNLPYEQAPVSYLNQAGYKALSFGTIHYSIDQTFTFYQNVLAQYKPKFLVVGIHNDPEVISNMFLPFRIHDTSAPFLKPAYQMAGNAVIKKQPPVEQQRSQAYADMMTELEKHDTHYYKFQIYKRLSLLPFSDLLRQTILAVEKEVLNQDAYQQAFQLQQYFMEAIVALAEQSGTEVIFVKIVAQEDQEQPFYKKLYPNKNALHTALLNEMPVNLIDTAEMLQETGRPLADFYQGHDTVHFSADACQLLATKIDQSIKALRAQR